MTTARLKDTPRHEAGALTELFGIVAGTLAQFADALDAEPADLMEAIRRADIDLLNDTAKRKAREKHTRPDDPHLRSLAMTQDDFARLLAHSSACGTSDHRPTGAVRSATAARPEPTEPDPMPATTSREKSKNLKVRMAPDLMERLEDAAQRDGRTVSGYVRHTLKRQLEVERRLFGDEIEVQ